MAQIPPADAQSGAQHAPKSANRERFMKASGLDVVEHRDPDGVQVLFATMKQLVEVKHRQIAIRENVRPEKECKEPFTFDSMKREVIQEALDDVHASAPPEVRAWLDHWQRKGSGRGNRHWAIEWFLYNRFRHTDYRNRPKPEMGGASNGSAAPGPQASFSTPDALRMSFEEGVSDLAASQAESNIPVPPASPGSDSSSTTGCCQRRFYDPVRDTYVNAIIDALERARL